MMVDAFVAIFLIHPSMAPPTFSIPDEEDVADSNEVRGATFGRCEAKSLLRPS